MRVVWKFTMIPDMECTITGGDPRVVHVAVDPFWVAQGLLDRLECNVPTVWVELDPDSAADELRLVFVGTGHPVPLGQTTRHVGSCVTPGGLVWHVYDLNPRVRELRG
jgi:hypothetical protein